MSRNDEDRITTIQAVVIRPTAGNIVQLPADITSMRAGSPIEVTLENATVKFTSVRLESGNNRLRVFIDAESITLSAPPENPV